MARRKETRTKKQLIERASEIGPLLQAAISARETVATKRKELEQLVVEEMAPVQEAEQAACKALYVASLIQTRKGLEPEELVVTIGKGRDRKTRVYVPTRTEIKKKQGRTVVKEQATDKDGNPLVDGNNEPILQPVLLRVDYGLRIKQEDEPERIEINLG